MILGVMESGNPGIRESGNPGIRESGNPGIREEIGIRWTDSFVRKRSG